MLEVLLAIHSRTPRWNSRWGDAVRREVGLSESAEALQFNRDVLLQDSEELQLGTDGDYKLTFDGTNLNLSAPSSGTILINSNQNNVDFQVKGSGENNALKVDAGTDSVGIGVPTPNAKLEVYDTSATADAVIRVLQLSGERLQGVPSAGFGVGIQFEIEDAGDQEIQAAIDAVFTTVTDGQEDVDFVFTLNKNGTLTEILRIDADADTIDLASQTATEVNASGSADLTTWTDALGAGADGSDDEDPQYAIVVEVGGTVGYIPWFTSV